MDKSQKKARKKTKVVGIQQYINTTTGELENFAVTSIEDCDFDFYKVWMKNFIFTMDVIGNQKNEIMFLDYRQSKQRQSVDNDVSADCRSSGCEPGNRASYDEQAD